MRVRGPGVWMWAEACESLERAERLQRQFFQPARAGTHQPVWEPPVDVFEGPGQILILVALPGVDPEQAEVKVEGGVLSVSGERQLPFKSSETRVRRLEIPYGRFERHIELPPGPLEIERRDLLNGCLLLTLRKTR